MTSGFGGVVLAGVPAGGLAGVLDWGFAGGFGGGLGFGAGESQRHGVTVNAIITDTNEQKKNV